MKHKISGDWDFKQGLVEISYFIDFLKVQGKLEVLDIKVFYRNRNLWGSDFVAIIYSKPINTEPVKLEMIDIPSFFKKDE